MKAGGSGGAATERGERAADWVNGMTDREWREQDRLRVREAGGKTTPLSSEDKELG